MITELIDSWIDMKQLKTDEVVQLNEQTIQPIDNEIIFYLLKPIMNKLKNMNKKNVNEKQTIIKKKKKKKKKKKNNSNEFVSKKIVKELDTINASVDDANVPDEIIS